jgi:hypothetical protein
MLFWAGTLVLALGALSLVVVLAAGGSDKTPTAPDKGFKPALPKQTHALSAADGHKVTKFSQLDPKIKSAMRHFIVGAVAGKNYGDAWKYMTREMRGGYTYKQWVSADEHPVIPYPIEDYSETNFNLVQANDEEVLVEVGVSAPHERHLRPLVFLIGVAPVGGGKHVRWLVDYWGPRYTPPIPLYQ